MLHLLKPKIWVLILSYHARLQFNLLQEAEATYDTDAYH